MKAFSCFRPSVRPSPVRVWSSCPDIRVPEILMIIVSQMDVDRHRSVIKAGSKLSYWLQMEAAETMCLTVSLYEHGVNLMDRPGRRDNYLSK